MLTKRGNWGVADQAAIALSNFLVGVVVARDAGPAGLGLYALAYAAILILVGVQRACFVDPWLIHHGRDALSSLRAIVAPTCFAYMLICATAVVAGAAEHEPLLAIIGVVALPILVQDLGRAVLLATVSARAVATNDALTGLVQVGVAVALASFGASGGLAGLGVGALVGAIWARPRIVSAVLSAARPARSELWQIGRWFTLDSFVFLGTFQMIPFTIAAVAGRSAVGVYQSYLSLFRPLALLGVGLASVWFVELARARTDAEVIPAYLKEVASVMVIGLVYACIAVALGGPIVPAVFGHSFQSVSIINVASLAVGAVAQLAFTLHIGLTRAAGLGRPVVAARGVAGITVLVAIVAIGTGSLWSVGLGMLIGSVLGSISLRLTAPSKTKAGTEPRIVSRHSFVWWASRFR
jgi:O-antigen/teichoic acid export membrane protein